MEYALNTLHNNTIITQRTITDYDYQKSKIAILQHTSSTKITTSL